MLITQRWVDMIEAPTKQEINFNNTFQNGGQGGGDDELCKCYVTGGELQLKVNFQVIRNRCKAGKVVTLNYI